VQQKSAISILSLGNLSPVVIAYIQKLSNRWITWAKGKKN